MYTAAQAQSDAERMAFCAPLGTGALDPSAVQALQPDAQWLLTDGSDLVARCSLWWRRVPTYQDHRVGLIGHYAARDAAGASQLLRAAGDELAGQGCTLAVGPMDSNTYQRYRLVTDRGTEPPFFLEPDNPAAWPAHFVASGFSVLARYCSALQLDLAAPDERLERITQRLERRGIRIRPLRLDHFERDVRAMHAIATASFSQSVLHTPIDADAFARLYQPLRAYVVPDLVLIAECDDVPVGLLFTLPDWLQAQREPRVTTLILKTIAVRPAFAGHGLAGALIARGLLTAQQLGYTRVIHALMHERNTSVRLSDRYHATIMRRYALYAKTLRRPR